MAKRPVVRRPLIRLILVLVALGLFLYGLTPAHAAGGSATGPAAGGAGSSAGGSGAPAPPDTAAVRADNYGVALAGYLVEVVSGQPFDQYVAQLPQGGADGRRILDPAMAAQLLARHYGPDPRLPRTGRGRARR
ncbi:hypothetical protein [Kitasatospora sp. NPDC085464]|uniref:hypothetical protein n=1 Tax=Kitasatospora sp. NPDC085464 TaxID=3364063 RepID=UPI0037CBBA3F